jgi:pilus assembly protein Flp/PilA
MTLHPGHGTSDIDGASIIRIHPTARTRTMTLDHLKATVAYVRARFGADEEGASLVEYALLVALIAVVCIVAIAFLGQSASSKFSAVGSGVGA